MLCSALSLGYSVINPLPCLQCPHIKTASRGNNMKTLPPLILGLGLLSSLASGAPGVLDKLTNTLQSVAKNTNQVNTALGCSTGNLQKIYAFTFVYLAMCR